jgi:hypothetical protein
MSRVVLSGLKVGKLPPLELALDSEVCAFVATPSDGFGALALVASGLTRSKVGTVRIDGEDPWARPELRRRIGTLFESEALSEDRTSRTQRFPDPISQRTARRAALARALAVEAPLCLCLVEPFLACTDRSQLVAGLVSRAANGAVVLCVVGNVDDAIALGGRVLAVESLGAPGPPAWRDWAPAELVVFVDDSEKLVAAMATELGDLIHAETRGPGELVLHASDLDAAALLAMKAAVSSGVRIVAIAGRSTSQLVSPKSIRGAAP